MIINLGDHYDDDSNRPLFDLCLPEYKERDDNDDLIVDYDDDGDNQ